MLVNPDCAFSVSNRTASLSFTKNCQIPHFLYIVSMFHEPSIECGNSSFRPSLLVVADESFAVFLYGIIGQMHVHIVHVSLIRFRVRNCRKSNKSITKHINSERITRSEQHVDSHIKFVTVNQKWLFS